MTAPYLSPRFHSPPEAVAAIGLDVRVGNARPVRYPFGGHEFRVGGATSCDLRLIGAHLPAHICRLVREAGQEVSFYRIDPAFPLLATGKPVGPDPVRLRHGDRIAIGPLDLTLHFADVHLSPQLEAGAPPPGERAALVRECDELRVEAARLAAELPDLEARREELEAVRLELDGLREALQSQYQQQREQLAERQREVIDRTEVIEQREAALSAAAEAQREREARLDERERELAEQPEPEPEGWPDRLAQVGHRESVATAAHAVLAVRVEEVARHELALVVREAALAEQARGLEARATAMELESRDLQAHAQALAEDAARLESLSMDLARREAGLEESLGQAAQREAAIERQSQKLREVGRAVVAAKREAQAARDALAQDQAQARVAADAAGEALAREQARTAAAAQASLDALKEQLAPLQADAVAAREALVEHAASLDRREAALEAATAEHRLAVAGLRQQTLALHVEAQARAERPLPPPAPPPTQEWREWYRRRLREVATPLLTHDRGPLEPLDPGDRQLADMLRTHQLGDEETLHALLQEAQRIRRPLRAVLLTGGAATLYQLAMIESGNLEALALGRLRVIDRVRVTPREVVYRVSDPHHATGPTRGLYLLRHLAEAEMDDAVRPDEFRQRFGAAHEATHLHLAQVAEVLEINGRPAVLCEQPAGAPSGDWPADAAHPGVWVRLLEGAAAGLAAAHRHGLAHGRLSSESFVLTPAGELKIVGVGEPMWLSTGVAPTLDPTPAADLRALGPVSFGWAQLAQPPGKRRTRGKAFPEPLLNVVRRLESDPETPMADTAAGAIPYESADELLADLARLSTHYPCPPAEWERLVSHAAAARSDGLRHPA